MKAWVVDLETVRCGRSLSPRIGTLSGCHWVEWLEWSQSRMFEFDFHEAAPGNGIFQCMEMQWKLRLVKMSRPRIWEAREWKAAATQHHGKPRTGRKMASQVQKQSVHRKWPKQPQMTEIKRKALSVHEWKPLREQQFHGGVEDGWPAKGQGDEEHLAPPTLLPVGGAAFNGESWSASFRSAPRPSFRKNRKQKHEGRSLRVAN